MIKSRNIGTGPLGYLGDGAADATAATMADFQTAQAELEATGQQQAQDPSSPYYKGDAQQGSQAVSLPSERDEWTGLTAGMDSRPPALVPPNGSYQIDGGFVLPNGDFVSYLDLARGGTAIARELLGPDSVVVKTADKITGTTGNGSVKTPVVAKLPQPSMPISPLLIAGGGLFVALIAWRLFRA